MSSQESWTAVKSTTSVVLFNSLISVPSELKKTLMLTFVCVMWDMGESRWEDENWYQWKIIKLEN